MKTQCKKVFVNPDNKAYILCPQCGFNKCITVDKFTGNHKVKVKCQCAHEFQITFDFRQHYRKALHLEGLYAAKSFQHIWQPMTVQNLSMSGVGFARKDKSNIAKGDRLLVRFALDDAHKSELDKEVIVCKVSDDFVGCKFVNLDLFEKTLGFYLLP